MNKILHDNDFNEIFTTLSSSERENFIVINYRLQRSELSIQESAALIAINTSLGTIKKLSFETFEERSKYSAKVVSSSDNGTVQIAYPIDLCEPNAGLAALLSLIWYSAEYNYTAGFRIESIEFPSKYLSYFKGPKFGIKGIRDKIGIHGRPIIGAIVKPRRGLSINELCKLCKSAFIGGVDIISDDELVIDPDGDFCFENRVKKLSKIAHEASRETGEKKWFIANITASPIKSITYAIKAKELGAGAFLINAFTMGFCSLEDISADSRVDLPIITCNMGSAVLTRPVQYTGVSEVFISAISRIAGADAVNSGIVGSAWYSNEAEHQSLSNLRSKFGDLKASLPIVSGGLNISNILPNLHEHGTDVMLQAGSGIFGFPGGPQLGAQIFKRIAGEFNIGMTRLETEKMLIELAKSNKNIQSALNSYNFEPKYTKSKDRS